MFFSGLQVRWVFGKRYLFCHHCGARPKRSIVPHLKAKHPREWLAAVDEWLRLKNTGLSYRRIMTLYTAQEGQYILSWTVIKREVKARAEAQELPVVGKPVKQVRRWGPESEPALDTTIWSFPRRGSWATHSPDYEGNWSPYVPRELIRQFSRKGDLVLDPFVGGGTTLIEAILLGRLAIGVDISPHALSHCRQRLEELRRFAEGALDLPFDLSNLDNVELRKGDARDLSFLGGESVDLICTHPPYGPAIRYTENVTEDLSRLRSSDEFLSSMAKAAAEFHRVLKPEGHCAMLVGDFRVGGKIFPLGLRLLQVFVDIAKFEPVDIIIKEQHQDSSTEFYYQKKSTLRYRLAHEYLLILRKRA